jgi:hypothetical protein
MNNKKRFEAGLRCQSIVEYSDLVLGSHMPPNFSTGSPRTIAAWNSAAHVEEPPKKKVPPTPAMP